jgi:hypothetical protein
MWCPTLVCAPRPRLVFAHLARICQEIAVVIALLCLAGVVLVAEGAMGQSQETTTRRPLLRGFPLTKFYDTPDPLPPGSPGEVIRSLPFDEYDVPMEVSAVRILYHSRSAHGADVAASGVVLFPGTPPPAGGWPVIAWAHDLNGVARTCAPSLTRNLGHGPLLSMYVHLGYAVVATDYTGLGTSFRNAFADLESNAFDVIYSVLAARSVVPQLGSRWIAVGTGEGGMAVLGVAEQEREVQDLGYLGSITISRLADLSNSYESIGNLSDEASLYLAYGTQTVYPQFQANDILTAKALPLYGQIGRACSNPESVRPPGSEMLKPKWQKNQFVQDYFRRNRIGLKPAKAPLLVLGSQTDPATAETIKIVARLCELGDHVHFEKYPESDPGRVVGDSVRDQIAWLQARFANKMAPNDCPAQPSTFRTHGPSSSRAR